MNEKTARQSLVRWGKSIFDRGLPAGSSVFSNMGQEFTIDSREAWAQGLPRRQAWLTRTTDEWDDILASASWETAARSRR
jgi:hypothetical protein